MIILGLVTGSRHYFGGRLEVESQKGREDMKTGRVESATGIPSGHYGGSMMDTVNT